MSSPDTTYIGRFAPTPSGPLHFGSLIAALASYLDARRNGGRWLLRIDNADTPRVQAGAIDSILHSLDVFGLDRDGEVFYQDQRREAYHAALSDLLERSLLYRCDCPRRLTRGGPYPGTCRYRKLPAQSKRRALRIITRVGAIGIRDRIQGDYYQDLASECGDFVVQRADGYTAYHLCTVMDDERQGVTHVVRGADLLSSTPRQVFLQHLLGLTTPVYSHFPVAVDINGHKICKQRLARPVLEGRTPPTALVEALEFLGQSPEPALLRAGVSEILAWAVHHWDLARVPRQLELPRDREEWGANKV